MSYGMTKPDSLSSVDYRYYLCWLQMTLFSPNRPALCLALSIYASFNWFTVKQSFEECADSEKRSWQSLFEEALIYYSPSEVRVKYNCTKKEIYPIYKVYGLQL